MKYSVILLPLLIVTKPQQCLSQNLFQRMARFATGKKSQGDGLVDVPSVKLTNGEEIPLVGLGVGNMLTQVVPAMVGHALQPDKNIRLFDTSNASQNEHLVAQGIVEGVEEVVRVTDKTQVEVHVITKVWYTHLGYERTMLSVKKSIEALKPALDHENVDLKLHVMIHWPRCYNAVEWMDCEGEERELSDEVKQAGPAPHLDRENAWKGSYKALEELYKDAESPVSSIGVSNFHLQELEVLAQISTVQPHIVETTVWSLLYDPLMVDYCHRHGIHMTAYHLMEGVIRKADATPFAYHHILVVASQLEKLMQERGHLGDEQELSAGQVVLAWLIQHQISVIPRTTDLFHLKENSAVSLQKIPSMSDEQVQTVAHSVEALISGEDVKEDAHVKLTFHAKSKDIYLYWHDTEYGGEIQVAMIKQGEKFEESSHPGHIFRIYETEDKQNMKVFEVEGSYGEHRHIEL